jgi:D-alanyl-D-alanine carboxypeptidase
MPIRHELFAFAAILLVPACTTNAGDEPQDQSHHGTSKTTSGTKADSAKPPSTSLDVAALNAAPAPLPPCDPAETERVERAVSANVPSGVDGAALVKTACGSRFFGAGRVDGDTLQRIGSVSKTYVGALMLKLVNDGRVRLEDPVARWVPGVPNGDQITLLHVLSHRSGLFDHTGDPNVVLGPRSWQPAELLAIVQQHPPSFAPGAQYQYCNANFLVAGLVAEAATGERLSALIHERILDPLGLRQTFFSPDDAFDTSRLARAIDEQGAEVTLLNDGSWAWGAGSMVATPSDVAAWVEALGSTRFFDPRSEQTLLAPWPGAQPPTDDPSMTYGLGIATHQTNLGPLIGHTGLINGYQTSVEHSEEHRVTVVAFVDRSPAPGTSDSVSLSNAVFGALFP